MGLVWLRCVKYLHRFYIALYYLTFTSCFMWFLSFTDVAGLVTVQSSDLPLRFPLFFLLIFPHARSFRGCRSLHGRWVPCFYISLEGWKKQHNLRPTMQHQWSRANETGNRCKGTAQILNNPFESPLPPAWPFKVCPMFYLSDEIKSPAQQSTPSVCWKSRPLSRTRGGTVGIRTRLWERTTNPNRLCGGNRPAVHGFADQIPLSWLWNHKIMRSKVQAWVFSPLFLLLTEVIFLPLPPSCGLRLPMFGAGLHLFPQTEEKTHGLALFKAVIQLPPCVLFNFDCGPYASHTNCHHQNCKSPKQLDFLETLG